MKTILAIITIYTCIFSSAYANDLSVDLNLASKHYNLQDDYEYNEKNLGIGLKYEMYYEVIKTGTFFGYYNNSYDKDTFYWSAYVEKEFKYLTPGIQIGLATGYEEQLRVPVVIAPYFEINLFERFKPRVGVIPAVGDKIGAFTFQINIDI